MYTDILTTRDALALAAVMNMAISTAHIGWIEDGSPVMQGTARHICSDESGRWLPGDQDVRSGFLRITTDAGFDVFMPMTKAVALAYRCEMVVL